MMTTKTFFSFFTRLIIGLASITTLTVHAQSVRPGMGATPYADANGTGVTFRTWAPNATSVGVKGQFNGWATTTMISEGASGNWSIDIPGARHGQEYKFRINNQDKRDPRARRVTNSAGNSVIYDPNAFNWGDHSFTTPGQNDLVIYQMHVGTYNAESWLPGTFDNAIERLDHVRNLGVSAIKVLPVNEYATDRSWGYNPSDLFAIESSLGGPDAFKRFVKASHDRGIAVLVDVVHNHYGPSDLDMWQYDGWSQNGLGGIYFYNELAKASTWWGDTRPDFSRPEVRQFIRDQIFMFLEEYRVDGFRWDSVFNIINYNNGGNQLVEGREMLKAINDEMAAAYPEKFRIAEDHAFDHGGMMNFQSVWEVGFCRDLRWQVTRASDADRNVNTVGNMITGWPSFQRVLFSESHDEVGDLNSKVRLPRDIDGSNPQSIWARKRQLLAASVVMTSPGIPMIFQGQEMNEDWTFSSDTALRWALTNQNAGIVRAYSDLVNLRRNKFGGTQGLRGLGVNAYDRDNAAKILTMVRWDAGGGTDDVVVVMNFSATTRENNSYDITFPSTGTWYLHYNSDDAIYGADFGNVGPSQVTATGNPARAPVDIGAYATLIFSKTAPAATGQVTVNPPAPVGCIPVEISYQPADGPLSGASAVTLMIGINNWQDIQNLVMTNYSGTFRTTYETPLGAGVLNFVFHNGAPEEERIYDNNLQRDWSLGIAECANMPATVTVQPPQPQGCVPLAITYVPNAGPLQDATNISLFIGRNGWNDVQTLPLVEAPAGTWTVNYPIPEETWQVNFVFHNGAPAETRIWDNNNGQDWNIIVSGCIPSFASGVFITNPVSAVTVSNSITTITVQGYSSSNIIGHVQLTNTLTGWSDIRPGSGVSWTANIPLGEGVNIFRVRGTSDTTNPNHGATDGASNVQYTADSSWPNGSNGGSGWGGGWRLSATEIAGHFLAGGTIANENIGPPSWGLWANSGNLSDAVRPFRTRLTDGDTFRMTFQNNSIETGGVTGIGFQNRFGQNLFEYFFVGGANFYSINDSLGVNDTTQGWTDQGQVLTFTVTGPDTYRFSINGGAPITGTFIDSSEAAVNQVRIFNAGAGGDSGGFQRNVYFTGMSITGMPLEAQTYLAEMVITRSFGPNSDPDGDGYATWEEELAGTDPFDANSRPPSAVMPRGMGIFEVDLENTVPGRWYDIFVSTNLMSEQWHKQGAARAGSGGPVTLIFTNTSATPNLFYRTGVSLTP